MPCINPGAIHRTKSFLVANSILVVIWFAYHVPVIFVPGVYSNPGIPTWASLLLFAIAITGFSFFVGACGRSTTTCGVQHSRTACGTTWCKVRGR